MDLAREKFSFLTESKPEGAAAAPASAALTGDIVRDLLVSPDVSREVLVAALQESTRQFQSLLSCVSGTFYRGEISPPWQMEFVSPGIEAICGYGPHEFAGMPFGALIVPEDQPALQRLIESAIARREHFSAFYRIRHRSGEIRWVSERGAAIFDSEGRLQFLEGFISDVTVARSLELEAERARNEVEQMSAQMTRILDCTLEGIVTFDRNWNYRFVNKAAWEEVLEAPAAIGGNLLELYPDFSETTAWAVMLRVMEEREPGGIECFFPGRNKWFEFYAVPDGDGITTFFRDISDRKRLEVALVHQADELRGTLDSIPDMVWSAHPDGRGDYFNKSWNDFMGWSRDSGDVFGEATADGWIHPEDAVAAHAAWEVSLETGQPFEGELRLRNHAGEYRWLLARGWPQRNERGDIVKWYGTAMDIHERIAAEDALDESRHVQANILEASTDSILILDCNGHMLLFNAPVARLAEEAGHGDVIGWRWIDLWPEDSMPAVRTALRRAQKGRVVRFSTYGSVTRGRRRFWDVILSPIRDSRGEMSRILCIARDVSEQKATSERLRIASEQDVLTGLPNRRAFERHLRKATRGAQESGGNVGLMLLDLDHFKHVNDTLGHLAGDHLLKAIARRLRACVKESGFVARLGGDEFAIVFSGIREDQELIGAATQILTRMQSPVTFAGKPINGGLSIGCALYPRDAGDAQSLLQHTDTALYDLKASGRGGIQMFNRRTLEAAARTATQLSHARAAIRDDAVEPYYQPKVRLDSGEISGFEALLRWWSPGNGIQPPSSVAEAFNDYELSTKIGGLMQRRILADMSGWIEQGLALPPVSINAAPAEFLRDDYAERLLDRLREFAIPSALIEVEITEHVFLERRSEQVIRALELLKSAGVRIALDDFGTGHSSLSHLRDFPVDVLKIDRSFVSRMITKPRMLAIVQAISKLGPSLSLDIVAEGVETPEQLCALREAGCQFGQGYLFGKAMHAAEVGRRLATENWPFKLREAR